MLTPALIAATLQLPAPPLAPHGSWQVASVGYSCSLARSYGTGRDLLTLHIKPADGVAAYDLYLLGSTRTVPPVARGSTGKVVIGSGTPEITYGYTDDTVDGRRLFRTSLTLATVDGITGSPAALAVTSGKLAVSLGGDALGKGLQALKTCHADALRKLGVDPTLWFQNRLAKLNNPARFFGNDGVSRADSPSGRVVVLLTFDTAGKVSGCTPVDGIKRTAATATCTIATAKVTARPVTSRDGTPIASYAFLPVVWQR